MGEPEGYDRKDFLYRIGTYFILIGIGLFVFFMLSENEQQTVFSYFCWSMFLFIIGFIFRTKFRRPGPPPSGRFSVLNRFKRKPKEEKK